jgi:hypothetical protein
MCTSSGYLTRGTETERKPPQVTKKRAEPVKGACGSPELGDGMRRVGEGQEERVESGARQTVSYKYEMSL